MDVKAGCIDLPGRTTKGKRARFLPIYGDMAPTATQTATETLRKVNGKLRWTERVDV